MELHRTFANTAEEVTPESRLLVSITLTHRELDLCRVSLSDAVVGEFPSLRPLREVFTEACTRTST